jgi:hypothetical protein
MVCISNEEMQNLARLNINVDTFALSMNHIDQTLGNSHHAYRSNMQHCEKCKFNMEILMTNNDRYILQVKYKLYVQT